MIREDNITLQVTVTRRNTMLAATTLAAASAFGSVAAIQKAVAAEPKKPSPEQIKQIGEYTNALATQAAFYGVSIVAMFLLRRSVCFGDKPKAASMSLIRLIWREPRKS